MKSAAVCHLLYLDKLQNIRNSFGSEESSAVLVVQVPELFTAWEMGDDYAKEVNDCCVRHRLGPRCFRKSA